MKSWLKCFKISLFPHYDIISYYASQKAIVSIFGIFLSLITTGRRDKNASRSIGQFYAVKRPPPLFSPSKTYYRPLHIAHYAFILLLHDDDEDARRPAKP